MNSANTAAARPAASVHHSGDFHWVGDGFPVRSVFSYNDRGLELSPFLLLDYAAPHEFKPAANKRGVGEHPHRGFETVTIVYQGELEHRDSSGGGGLIGAGDVQWMTAGAGLVHEEFHSRRFTEQGGTFEVIQLWVNLPAKDKSAKPGYQTLSKDSIPVVDLPEGAGTVRVIAGEFGGKKGPSKTFTPLDLWDAAIKAGSSADLKVRAGHTKAVLVLRGSVTVQGQRAGEGDLVIIDRDQDRLRMDAAEDSKLLILSGEPIDEPVVGHGPFVMNSEAEIRQAFVDFKQGKYGSFES